MFGRQIKRSEAEGEQDRRSPRRGWRVNRAGVSPSHHTRRQISQNDPLQVNRPSCGASEQYIAVEVTTREH